MKKIQIIFALFILMCSVAMAQAPQSVPYQAVARNASGNLIANQTVALRFSIHDVTSNGTVVYQETQSATTNALGLFTANIGSGTPVIGTFITISWGSGAKFAQVEIDTANGNNYVDMGTQQLMSVPYALYASTSGSGAGLPQGVNTGDVIMYDQNGNDWVAKTLTVNTTTSNAGGSQPFSIMNPYLALNFCIATQGIFPSRNGENPYLGEIEIFGFNFAPVGWELCDGQILPISQNTALFSLLGTMYGGDGQTTFALPNLQSRLPICIGQGNGLSFYNQGDHSGAETAQLTINQIPSHTHTATSTVIFTAP